jgi:dUTP pyrophosphatase
MLLKIRNTSHHPLPDYETEGASGMDLRAYVAESITLKALERTLVPTGLFVEIPIGYEGQVRPRSGLSIKHGISLVNCVGTIDSDYRGELKIPVINLSNETYTIQDGERIAQLVIASYERVKTVAVEELSDTERGKGGFGSTGTK